MSSFERGLELAAKLAAEGVTATVDPRSATPPCVLVTPPNRQPDLACGYTAEWSLWALVPGPGNADAWKMLDVLCDGVARVFGPVRADFAEYSVSVDSPALPAYRLTFSEALE